MPLLPASLRNDRAASPVAQIEPHCAGDAHCGASDESLKLLVAGCQHFPVKQWNASGAAAVGAHALAPAQGGMGAGTLHCVARRFDEHEVVELFIGQLPYGVEPIGLLDIFQQLLQAKGTHKKPIVYRLKTGWQPTCAFVAVGAQYADALLAFSKRLLCDRAGFWVAPVGDDGALSALTKASDDRHKCPVEGLPSVPMVIERIKEGKMGTRCHRTATRRAPGAPAQPPPPSYPAFPSYPSLAQQFVVVDPAYLQSTVPRGVFGNDPFTGSSCSPFRFSGGEDRNGACGHANATAVATPKWQEPSPVYFWCAAPTAMETTVGGR